MKFVSAITALSTLLIIPAHATMRMVVIGDSLSAEYESTNLPGISESLAYAKVTVPGVESKSWVEVLGQLRTSNGSIDLGEYKASLPGWADLRFNGYKYNFGIPGFTAAQYEDVVDCTLFKNPQYLLYKQTLSNAIKESDAAVIWLGANDTRSAYASLYAGADPTNFVNNYRTDLTAIVNFALRQKGGLKLVLGTVPDLGATPSVQRDYPNAAQRALVSNAIEKLNQVIVEIAAARSLPVADIYASTRKVIAGQVTYFGGVDIYNQLSPDNLQRYSFTRDGFHPNTAQQIVIARIFLDAFNQGYHTAIPQIRDSEALKLLGINPLQPYLEWAQAYGIANEAPADDNDGDGISNFAEYAFGSDPTRPNAAPLTIAIENGHPVARFQVNPETSRLARVQPQWSTDLKTWIDVPSSWVNSDAFGRTAIGHPVDEAHVFTKLDISVREVQ